MRPGKDEFGLRLAAKAADREKAARQEWPAFEKRLKQLGYGSRAIAHAFSTLSGPGTVAEALEALKDMSRPESRPVALSFEVTETCRGPSAANGVTIMSVERDDFGIRVNYDIAQPLGFGSHGPRGEAKDDLGNDYHNLGSHFGLARGGWRGALTGRISARSPRLAYGLIVNERSASTSSRLLVRTRTDSDSISSFVAAPRSGSRLPRRVDGRVVLRH
jgi:hypothetical protein